MVDNQIPVLGSWTLEMEMCHDIFHGVKDFPRFLSNITEYLKNQQGCHRLQGGIGLQGARLERELSSGILVNLSFINRIPRAVALRFGRNCV